MNTHSPAGVSRRAAPLMMLATAAIGMDAVSSKATALAGPKKTTRGYAEGPFGLVHFQDTREGIPLLLLHAAPHTSRQFDQVYDRFAANGIRAIGIDTPGFGMSDVTPDVPTVEQWATIVPAVMDHLKIRKAHILGHHTGALIATEATLRYPNLFDKLVMTGTLAITEPERAARLAEVEKNEKNASMEPDGSHLTRGYAERRKAFGPNATDEIMTKYVVERYMGYGPSWYGHWAAYKYDHGAALMKIKHPTLVISNTGDSIHERTMRTQKLRPDFKFAVLEGGTYDIVDQQPEAWAAAVIGFIKNTV